MKSGLKWDGKEDLFDPNELVVQHARPKLWANCFDGAPIKFIVYLKANAFNIQTIY